MIGGPESEMNLFLMFVKADERVAPQRTDNQRRVGAPAGPMDWPLMRYCMSLEWRIANVKYAMVEVVKWNDRSVEEMERISRKGSGTYMPTRILVYHFESLVDQIFKTMENIAKVNLFLFESKSNPPHDFLGQMERAKKDALQFNESYSRVMKNQMEWYEDVPRIRNNSSHYVSGTGVFEYGDDGKPVPVYQSYEISERKENRSGSTKIKFRILPTVQKWRNELLSCIDSIGRAWLEELDDEMACLIPYIYPDRTEFRKISLRDYRAGLEGEVAGTTRIRRQSDTEGGRQGNQES